MVSAGKIEWFGQNSTSVEIPPLERTTHLFFMSLYAADKMFHRSGQF